MNSISEKTTANFGAKETTSPQYRITAIVACVALVLMLISASVMNAVQTSGGDVEIHKIIYVTSDGAELAGKLYVPKSATPKTQAPAVLAVHGYTCNSETQSASAVELSRRGFVVLAIDTYSHGNSTTPPASINEGKALDIGSYSALQYLGTLPYVDTARIGMVGHSMGCRAIQYAAEKCIKMLAEGRDIIVPTAMLFTGNATQINSETGEFTLKDLTLNVVVVNAQFDEFSEILWGAGIKNGKDVPTSLKCVASMGFSGIEFNTYHRYGESTNISREDAIKAALDGQFRVFYSIPHSHNMLFMTRQPIGDIVDFFDITLANGQSAVALPLTDQAWPVQTGFGAVGIISFFTFATCLVLLFLKAPFFRTLVRPVSAGLTDVTGRKSLLRYIVIYVIGLLPAPLLYNRCVGYVFQLPCWGPNAVATIPLKVNSWFRMAPVNGVMLFSVLTGLIAMAIYFVVFFLFAKKAGYGIDNMGVRLSVREIGKSFLLAAAAFLIAYASDTALNYFFKVDFSILKMSIRPMSILKWEAWIKYLPFFIIAFVFNGIVQNTLVRINGKKEWLNMLLIAGSSVIGLLVLHIIDYSSLLNTGVKAFEYIPGTGKSAAFAGVILFPLLPVLPASAVISRLIYKKAGTVWPGAFFNALMITFYAVALPSLSI